MLNKIKSMLFFLTLIAFLFSATFGFAATQTPVAGEDNSVVFKDDFKANKDKDDDDDDDDDKDKDDDDKDK